MHKILISVLGLLLAQPQSAMGTTNIVKRVENYINNITTMNGAFTQDGPGERFETGEFWISRPGRMRFNYKSRSNMFVVSDGVWLGVKTNAQTPIERYPLGATPARFLLNSNLRIGREAKVENVKESKNKISLWLISNDSNLSGKINLRFRKYPLALEGWTIIDAQGMTTQIRLKKVLRGSKIDPAMFFIKNESVFKKRGRKK